MCGKKIDHDYGLDLKTPKTPQAAFGFRTPGVPRFFFSHSRPVKIAMAMRASSKSAFEAAFSQRLRDVKSMAESNFHAQPAGNSGEIPASDGLVHMLLGVGPPPSMPETSSNFAEDFAFPSSVHDYAYPTAPVSHFSSHSIPCADGNLKFSMSNPIDGMPIRIFHAQRGYCTILPTPRSFSGVVHAPSSPSLLPKLTANQVEKITTFASSSTGSHVKIHVYAPIDAFSPLLDDPFEAWGPGWESSTGSYRSACWRPISTASSESQRWPTLHSILRNGIPGVMLPLCGALSAFGEDGCVFEPFYLRRCDVYDMQIDITRSGFFERCASCLDVGVRRMQYIRRRDRFLRTHEAARERNKGLEEVLRRKRKAYKRASRARSARRAKKSVAARDLGSDNEDHLIIDDEDDEDDGSEDGDDDEDDEDDEFATNLDFWTSKECRPIVKPPRCVFAGCSALSMPAQLSSVLSMSAPMPAIVIREDGQPAPPAAPVAASKARKKSCSGGGGGFTPSKQRLVNFYAWRKSMFENVCGSGMVFRYSLLYHPAMTVERDMSYSSEPPSSSLLHKHLRGQFAPWKHTGNHFGECYVVPSIHGNLYMRNLVSGTRLTFKVTSLFTFLHVEFYASVYIFSMHALQFPCFSAHAIEILSREAKTSRASARLSIRC